MKRYRIFLIDRETDEQTEIEDTNSKDMAYAIANTHYERGITSVVIYDTCKEDALPF